MVALVLSRANSFSLGKWSSRRGRRNEGSLKDGRAARITDLVGSDGWRNTNLSGVRTSSTCDLSTHTAQMLYLSMYDPLKRAHLKREPLTHDSLK